MRNLHLLIERAKKKLPLDVLMKRLGYEAYIKASCRSPFRDEKNASWGVFKNEKGELKFKDFTSGESGDQIDFLIEHLKCSSQEAQDAFFEMAGITAEDMHAVVGNGYAARNASRGHSRPSVSSPPHPSAEESESPTGLRPFDWEGCVAALGTEQIEKVAKWRGYDPEFVHWLKEQKLLGLHRGCPATPVIVDGTVVGCQYRTAAGPRYANATPGVKTPAEPLVFGNPAGDFFFVMESPWDCFAMMQELGQNLNPHDACFAVTRSAANFAKLGPLLEARSKANTEHVDVILVGQNDKPRLDKKPTGHQQLEAGVRKLCADFGLTLRVAFPPKPHKDLNDWIKGDPAPDVVSMLEATGITTDSRLIVRDPTDIFDMNHNNDDNYMGDRMLAKSQPAAFLGQGGVGKSRMLMQLAICCILGKPFCGIETHAKGRRWLIIQTENSNRRLSMDLKGIYEGLALTPQDRCDLKQMLLIHTIETENDLNVILENRDDYAQVERLITDVNPVFVAWDPLYTFTYGNLDSDQDMRAVLAAIMRATKRGNPNRVPLVLHHAGTGRAGAAKVSGWDKTSFGRNSKALFNWTRSQLNIGPRDPDDNTKLVMVCGKNSNGAPFEPIGIMFNQEKHIYEVDPEFDLEAFREDVEDRKQTGSKTQPKNLGAVMELLGDDSISKTDLRNALMTKHNLGRDAAYRLIKDAESAGLITTMKVGCRDYCSRK